LTLALAVLASLAPAIALGLGLGDIRLHSALNQPLDAEIDLLAATDDELNSIKVRLATNDQFDRYGIERVAALASFKFEVVKRPDGRAYVHITSDQSLREPFLTFLVEASWPRGRLLREYTVLLDPPVLAPAPQDAYAAEPVAETVAASPYAAPVTAGEPAAQPTYVQPEPTAAPVIETAVATAPSTAPVAPTDAPAQPQDGSGAMSGADASNYGPVRRGETLWAISARLKPEQAVTMNQMMIAVFRANPDAFRGNINRLKRGAILRIPDASEITSISVADANAEAIRHNDEWQATRVAVTTTPSASAPVENAPVAVPEPQPAPVAAAPVTPPKKKQPKAEPAAPTPAAPAISAPTVAAPSQPSLAIVAPSDDLGAPSTDPAARVADLEKQLEEAKTAGTSTKRKRDRIARLEKELGEARAALTVPSDTLAQIQDQAATPSTVAPAATPTTTPAAAPATVAAEPAQAPVRHKKGLLDTLLENLFNPIVLMLLALAVLLPIGAIGFKKMKARQAAKRAAAGELAPWGEESSDEDKTVVGGDEPTQHEPRGANMRGEEPTVMRGPDPGLLAPTGETVAIPDEQVQKTVMLPRDQLDQTIMQTMAVEKPAPMVMEPAVEPVGHQTETIVGGTPLKLDENDPMSEADFHMAYGLYDQAADLIKKASQREPARRDLRLKLLEIYFSAGNKGSFVSEAKALRESMGPRPDADWNNVVIFGKQIAPEEGMFNEMAAATASVDFDASAAGGAPSTSSDLAFDPFAAPEPAAAPAPAAAPVPAAVAPVVDVPLEFELGDFEIDAKPKAAAAPPAPAAPSRKEHTDSQSDFDKALAELSAFVDTNVPKVAGGDAAAADGGELDLGEIQLDEGGLEVEEESAASEIDTKLDLARAYIDMMDPGSAKGILEEVLADGDDKQKAEAQKLLSQLG
jgi:pilus assembly protein FimV